MSKIVIRAAIALCWCPVLGCVDVGVERIAVPLHVAGTAVDGPFAGRDDAQIELSRAELAFGPLYLCAGAQAGELCETARLEWLDAVVVDLLDPDPIAAGELEGLEGTVRSWMYDLGIVSLLTQNQPLVLAAAEELGDASLVLDGRASVGDVTIPFAITLVVAQEEGETEIGVPVVRKSSSEDFNHRVTADEPGLLIRFDPRPFVGEIDFVGLLEDGECAPDGAMVVCAGQTEQTCDVDGSVSGIRDCAALGQVCVRGQGCVEVVEFEPDSQGWRAVRNQVVAGARPSFVWGYEG